MKGGVIGVLALAAMLFMSGCATTAVYTTARDAPHGFVEFYVVPTYDETVVYKDAFAVSVAHRESGREPKTLGKTHASVFDGRRLRVACAPGTHEFVLRPRCLEKDRVEQRSFPCVVDITLGKVTPVRLGILVHETDSMGKRAAGKLLLGPVLRSAIMEGAGYDMRVDVLPPQPYYELYSTTRGWNGVITIIEAHSETEGQGIKARIDKARESLDLRRKEDRAIFKDRYERSRARPGAGGSLVRIGAMANDISFAWSTMTFDE